MTFNEFWALLVQGGITPKGDIYSVTDDGRLHILSSGNKNKKYFFTQAISERYFTHDIPEMGETKFRQKRSSYFINVHTHVVQGKLL